MELIFKGLDACLWTMKCNRVVHGAGSLARSVSVVNLCVHECYKLHSQLQDWITLHQFPVVKKIYFTQCSKYAEEFHLTKPTIRHIFRRYIHRYFCDFGLVGEIWYGLTSWFLWCFHYYKWPYIEVEIFREDWLVKFAKITTHTAPEWCKYS